jgi:hypothetical protein
VLAGPAVLVPPLLGKADAEGFAVDNDTGEEYAGGEPEKVEERGGYTAAAGKAF